MKQREWVLTIWTAAIFIAAVVPFASAQTWETTVETGAPSVADASIVEWGNDALIFGGVVSDEQDDRYSEIEKAFFGDYDETTKTHKWNEEIYSDKTAPISKRKRQAAWTMNDLKKELYVFGGEYQDEQSGETTYLNDLWKYDLETKEWSQLEPQGDVPSPRSGHAVINYSDDKAYFLGGKGEDNQVLAEWHEYERTPMTAYFEKLDDIPHPGEGFDMIYWDPYIFVYELFFGATKMYKYNLDGRQWHEIADMGHSPNYTTDAATVNIGNGVGVQCGGTTYVPASNGPGKTAGFEVSKAVWQFDCKTETWTQLADLPEAVTSAVALYDRVNHKIKVYGGMKADGTINDQVFVYTLEGTGVAEQVEMPETFGLGQNYPNPFNPHTTISFDVKEMCNVKLDIYNLRGQHIANLVDNVKQAGQYKVPFDASGLASGIYFYRIRVGNASTGSGHDFVAVRKMVVLE